MPKHDTNKPAPPKRPLAPFFLFKQDVYDQVKKEHPESKITELTQIIAQKWKLVSPEQKASRYEALHEDGKKKYEREKKEYEDRYGKPDKKSKKKPKKSGNKK